MMAFEPGEQRWSKVEADVGVVVDGSSVGAITLRVNALVPIVERRGARLALDFTRPGILTRWLIKMTVNYKSNHTLTGLTGFRQKCQTRGAHQAGVITTLRTRDFHLLSRRTKSALANLSIHLISKQIPPVHYSTTDHDNFRVNQIDQVRKTNPEIHTQTFKTREREFITCLSSHVHLDGCQLITMQNRLWIRRQVLPRHTHNRCRRSKQFQA